MKPCITAKNGSHNWDHVCSNCDFGSMCEDKNDKFSVALGVVFACSFITMLGLSMCCAIFILAGQATCKTSYALFNVKPDVCKRIDEVFN